jgi:sulfatase maturation enzyme AslB (radical SAM superfamily)
MKKTFQGIDLVNLSITNKCILQCPSCPTGRKNFISQKALKYTPRDTCIKIFRKVLNIYGKQTFYLHIWNEPLIHPQIHEVLAALYSFGHTAFASSNLNLKQDWGKLLNAPALKVLVVSMSGYHQKTYERGHRGGNVELVLNNIKEIGKHTRDSQTQVVLNFHQYKDNEEDAAILESLCNEYGIIFKPYLASLLQDHIHEDVVAGSPRWKQNSDAMELVLPRLKFQPFPFTSISNVAPVPCHSQNHVLVLDYEGNICTCTHKGPEDPNRLGNFLTMTKDEIDKAKKEAPVCVECRKLGLHLEYAFACFFERPSRDSSETIALLKGSALSPSFINKKIFVFGAGMSGGAVAPFLKHRGYQVQGFIDDDPRKIGTLIHGLPVYEFSEVLCNYPEAIIIDTIRSSPVRKIVDENSQGIGISVYSAEDFLYTIVKDA